MRTWMVLLALAPSLVAHADEKAAREAFEAGERAYNLGEFDRAVELFKKAYEEWPEPAFLFNLAQTYRQAGDCKQASFFYKRFLSLKERDTKKPLRPELKTEVQNRIAELDECVKREIASKPPTALDNAQDAGTTTQPTTSTADASTDGDDPPAADDTTEVDADLTARADAQPSLVSLRLGLGAALLNAGDLDVPVQFAGALVGGYPLAINEKLGIEVGAAFMFRPVPYTTTMGESGTGAVLGILANAGPSYAITPELSVRGDIGLGALVFSGLTKAGNPFTMNGTPATGALGTFMVRAAVSGDYAITPNVLVTLTPLAFTYSPAPTGFAPSVSSLTTLSFLAGVAYRR